MFPASKPPLGDWPLSIGVLLQVDVGISPCTERNVPSLQAYADMTANIMNL